MQVLRGSEKEQEIEGMIRCGRDTASGNLLLNCRASEEVIDSLLKRCAIGPKDVTTDDAVVVAEEEKEEEKEEIEIEEEEDAGEIKLLESIQPLQPLKLQKKDSKGEQAPAL